MNYKNAARPKVTIKQILPIPDGYRVLEPVGDENGNETMVCFRHAAVGYCLALLEGEHCDYVVPYEIGPDGMGRVESGMLVPVRYCPVCLREMDPHAKMYDPASLFYTCRCGVKGNGQELDDLEWEKENENK